MRFGWKAKRSDRKGRLSSLAAAVALTVIIGAIFSGAIGRSYSALRGTLIQRIARTYEAIVFVTPGRREAVVTPRPTPTTRTATRPEVPATQPGAPGSAPATSPG